MSKNIVMQQKTANGYEDLYPKADGDSSVIVNNTTNQFLGGGSTVGDALGYLSKFGMYWWKKVYQQPNYAIKYSSTVNTYTIFDRYVTYPDLPNRERYYTVVDQYSLVLYTSLNCNSSGIIYGEGAINVPLKISIRVVDQGGNNRGVVGYSFQIDGAWTSFLGNYYVQRESGFFKATGSSSLTAPTRDINTGAGSKTLSTTIVQQGYLASSYISSYTTTTTYICSSDPNAYPDQGNTDSSGAQYWKVGQPWEFLPKLGKVETGYYTGTGSGNVTLTFENAPQFVFISYKSTTDGGHASCAWCKDSSNGPYWVTGSSIQANTITQSGNNLTFTDMNKNAVAYQYFAITQ